MQQELKERIDSLLLAHAARPIVYENKTGRLRPVYGSGVAGKYQGPDADPFVAPEIMGYEEEINFSYDYSKNHQAEAELYTIGKNAVPYLLTYITEEIPIEFRYQNNERVDAVSVIGSSTTFLTKMADQEDIRSLTPYLGVKLKAVQINDYPQQRGVGSQLSSMINLFRDFNLGESIPLLNSVLDQLRPRDSLDVFSNVLRASYYNLAQSATMESINLIFQHIESLDERARIDPMQYAVTSDLRWAAMEALRSNRDSVGWLLFKTYCSNQNDSVKFVASKALGHIRILWWIRSKLGLHPK